MSVRTNELQKVGSVTSADSFIIDSETKGTGRLTLEDAVEFFRGAFMAGGVGGVPYGKELTEGWAALQARIKTGNFEGIHIGDYKTIQLTTGEKVIMEVAGIDAEHHGLQYAARRPEAVYYRKACAFGGTLRRCRRADR